MNAQTVVDQAVVIAELQRLLADATARVQELEAQLSDGGEEESLSNGRPERDFAERGV